MCVIDSRVKAILQECEDRIKKITKDNTISVLVFSKKVEMKLTFDDIVDFVCGVTGENRNYIMKAGRKREMVIARHLIIYFSFHYTTMSKSGIARRLDQDHTTIISAIKKVDDLLFAKDKTVSGYVSEINNIIQSLTNNDDRTPTTRTPDGYDEAVSGSSKQLLQRSS